MNALLSPAPAFSHGFAVQAGGTGSRIGWGQEQEEGSMSQPNSTTAVLDLSLIDVEDGVNPRTHFDEASLAELEESIRQDGLVTAFTVVPKKGGRFSLIAGERRLIAARRAGCTEGPAVIRPIKGSREATLKASRAATLVENLIREDLDPIDAAQGLADLAEAENLTTHQKIADRIGRKKGAGWVSAHLRLLKLPRGVQGLIARGQIPVDGERPLRKVAKVSPRVAECICELAVRKNVKGGDFVRCFDDLFQLTAESRFENPPTMISPKAVRISQVVEDPKKRRDLGDRNRVLHPGHPSEPVVRLSEDEIDAARAAVCLVEHVVDHGEWSQTHSFITDTAFAADLAERAVEREEKAEAKRKKEWDEYQSTRSGSSNGAGPDDEETPKKSAYQERQKQREEARDWNQEVGRELLKRRGDSSRKEFALARVKALALAFIHQNPKLAAAGLRLVMEQLQDVEMKQLKTTGATKEKVSYAGDEECCQYLEKRVEKARSINEVLELTVGDAVVASFLADENELPQSKRVGGGIYDPAMEKLLSADIKAVRPRRRRKSRK
jgi:ParB/RepB/Spo0J family partition protein